VNGVRGRYRPFRAGFAKMASAKMPAKRVLSSFGTERPRTDAENPQVNRYLTMDRSRAADLLI
jgi:hypothetical protein